MLLRQQEHRGSEIKIQLDSHATFLVATAEMSKMNVAEVMKLRSVVIAECGPNFREDEYHSFIQIFFL